MLPAVKICYGVGNHPSDQFWLQWLWKDSISHQRKKQPCEMVSAAGSAVVCPGNSTDASSHAPANTEMGVQLQLLHALPVFRSMWQYVSCVTLHTKYLKKVKPLNKQRKILLKKWSLIHSNRIWQYYLSLTLSQHFPFEPGTNEGMLNISTSDGELQEQNKQTNKVSRTIAVLWNRELPWANPCLVLLIWPNQNYSTRDRNLFNQVPYPGLYRPGITSPILSKFRSYQPKTRFINTWEQTTNWLC